MRFGGSGQGMRAAAGMLTLASALVCHAAWAAPALTTAVVTCGTDLASPLSYVLNHRALDVCAVVGVVVLGIMALAMFRFRHLRGASPEPGSHHGRVEILWSLVPLAILAALACLATQAPNPLTDNTDARMTIKVSRVPDGWRYDYVSYLGKPVVGIAAHSACGNGLDQGSPASASAGQRADATALVVPVDTKIQFALVDADASAGCRSAPVPSLRVSDAGNIRLGWTMLTTPGTYLARCGQPAGSSQAMLPITVKAVSTADFVQWLRQHDSSPTASVRAMPD